MSGSTLGESGDDETVTNFLIPKVVVDTLKWLKPILLAEIIIDEASELDNFSATPSGGGITT